MKRLISIIFVLIFVFSLCAFPAQAAEDLDSAFRGATSFLDAFYNLNGYYMTYKIGDVLYPWEERDANGYADKIVSAAEYEAAVNTYFAPTEQDWTQIRSSANYNAAEQTYTIVAAGGMGGCLPEREYLGYSKNGNTYNIYWQTIEYAYLSQALPEGTSEWAYAESLGYPSEITYNGITYVNGPDGYYRVTAMLDSGNLYVAEYNNGIVRLLSSRTYTAADLPVFADVPADNSVSVDAGNSFSAGTTVSVSKVTTTQVVSTATTALSKIATSFQVFSFSATKNGASVQPNGSVKVTFAIPSGFSTNVSVYYMANNGTIEKISATVDAANRTVTAALPHFSYYVLTDNATAPTTTTQPTETPTESTTPSTDATDPTEEDAAPTDSTDPTDNTDTPDNTDPTDDTATPDTDSTDGSSIPTIGAQEDKPDNTWIWIVLAIVVLAGAGVGGYFLYIKKFKK